MTTRVQVRDPAMNITASYETEDAEEAVQVGLDLSIKRPDLIVEVVQVAGPIR